MASKPKPPSPYARAAPPGNDVRLVNLASGGKTEDVRALLDAGVPVNSQYSDFSTALHYAVSHRRLETARLLLDRGAAPDLQDYQGRTPLWIAIDYGHQPIVQLLLDAGASTEIPNRAGVTPFLKALFTSSMGVAADRTAWRKIVQGVIARTANLSATMPDGRTPRALIAADLRDLLPDG